MSDNKDLKSKILLMRQNFGEIINKANEKNDNEKLIDAKPNNEEANTELIKIKMILMKIKLKKMSV